MSKPSYNELEMQAKKQAEELERLKALVERGAKTPDPETSSLKPILSVGPKGTLVIQSPWRGRPLYARYPAQFFEHIVSNLGDICEFTLENVERFNFEGNQYVTAEKRKADTVALARAVIETLRS